MAEIIIQGRPDFHNSKFGVTHAKRHPKYVYGPSLGLLVHEIAHVELHWYTVANHGHDLKRLTSPRITITTNCGQNFFAQPKNGKPRSVVCEMPKAEAVLCGRCQGKGPIFPKRSSWLVEKQEAKSRLGCADIARLD